MRRKPFFTIRIVESFESLGALSQEPGSISSGPVYKREKKKKSKILLVELWNVFFDFTEHKVAAIVGPLRRVCVVALMAQENPAIQQVSDIPGSVVVVCSWLLTLEELLSAPLRLAGRRAL